MTSVSGNVTGVSESLDLYLHVDYIYIHMYISTEPLYNVYMLRTDLKLPDHF